MDKMRWRYGDTCPVMAPVREDTIIEIGDLVWQDEDGYAYPACAVSSQCRFGAAFLGVAMQRSHIRDMAPIRVATTGVFEFDCLVTKFKLGDTVCPQFDDHTEHLANQVVGLCIDNSIAIGRAAKYEFQDVNRVLVDIRSRVMGNGVL